MCECEQECQTGEILEAAEVGKRNFATSIQLSVAQFHCYTIKKTYSLLWGW